MSLPRFIQIHTLHTYPAALLNRDDSGLAKRLPYGDAIRTRISSQCLKRHWRVAEDRFALSSLGVPMAVRSRVTLDLIRKELVIRGIAEDQAQITVEGLRNAGLLDKANAKKGQEALETGQAVLLGRAEINYLVDVSEKLARDHGTEKELKAAIAAFLKENKKNLEAVKYGSGLESALFGRMVTSDLLTSREAAVYVAHAFTVHAAQVENDYFTVVDDLMREAGEQGSAGIFDTELASGLYYGYVVIDVPQLVANLEGIATKDWASLPASARELAGQVVHHLIHLIATVSPGAKRGSTAPFSYADFMLVEAGDWQPRSLAAAFQNSLPLDSTNITSAAVNRLASELSSLDQAFGATLARSYLTRAEVALPEAGRRTLAEIASWVATSIVAAKAEHSMVA